MGYKIGLKSLILTAFYRQTQEGLEVNAYRTLAMLT